MAAEKTGSKAQAWFCTTGLPSDIVVEVDEMGFHLHKFPLMSKSRKLHRMITEQEEQRGRQNEEEIEEEDDELHHIAFPDFPGGSDAFETAAKFCYGVKIDLTAWTAAPVRCAAEYLEMTEDFAEDNLIARSERFLAQSVLRNLKESVKALKSCEDLMPLAEDLGIPQICIESITARACSTDPSTLFGWPVSEGAAAGDPKTSAAAVLWNGIETGVRRKGGARSAVAAADSWFDDLTMLSLPTYKRVIEAMRARDLSPVAIEGSLISYAKCSIPGLSRSSRKHTSAPIANELEQRELLEIVVTNLPQEKSSGGLMTTRFLFGLLRTVNILRASEAARTALERKIASQLERATLDDLLMPSYSYLVDTLYDVDCVERMLGYFREGREERAAIIPAEEEEAAAAAGEGGGAQGDRALLVVGKLVDGYLAEIASDANLKADKFCDQARVFDDGLYRAVDVFLKAHPGLTERERERVCSVMDSQKLTLEACTHAAQNERLPLRSVVQVLFFEQLQLRREIAGTLLAADASAGARTPETARPVSNGGGERAEGGGVVWRLAVRENQVLRLDMDSMTNRVHELERECTTMRRALEKMDKGGDPGGAGRREAKGKGWSRFNMKCGCKFPAQVCDSQQRTVVQPRRPRTEEHST